MKYEQALPDLVREKILSKTQKHYLCLLFFSGLFISQWLAAEVVYVSDTLRVGVRPQADNRVAPISVVTTGMRLEVLDRNQGYLLIKAPNGVQGWIKDIYVIDSAPAVIRLQQLQQQHKQSMTELNGLKESNKILKLANRSLNQKLEQLGAERREWQLKEARQQAEQVLPEYASKPWIWWLLAMLLLSVAGFIGGVSWYRQHITRRLGGLRV